MIKNPARAYIPDAASNAENSQLLLAWLVPPLTGPLPLGLTPCQSGAGHPATPTALTPRPPMSPPAKLFFFSPPHACDWPRTTFCFHPFAATLSGFPIPPSPYPLFVGLTQTSFALTQFSHPHFNCASNQVFHNVCRIRAVCFSQRGSSRPRHQGIMYDSMKPPADHDLNADAREVSSRF